MKLIIYRMCKSYQYIASFPNLRIALLRLRFKDKSSCCSGFINLRDLFLLGSVGLPQGS